ncbi:MAG: hypothetical protein EPO26_03205 [Chloroflexota bacterium]|nr:MAG: hypothetical protein EPO26_03205 [Chloroflexota bacterium]
MTISIYSNIAGDRARLYLGRVSADLEKVTTRLASGLRLRSDTSNYYAADLLESRLRGIQAASNNVQQAVSALTIAESALTSISDEYVGRLIEIAVLAADGLTTNAQRTTLDAEFQQIKTSINDLIAQTTFAGKTLLDGSLAAAVTIQVGADGTATQSIDFTKNFRTDAATGPLKTVGASGAGLDVLSQVNASNALAELNGVAAVPPNAVVAFADARIAIGASLSTFEGFEDQNALAVVDYTDARDTLIAADIAAETSRLVRDQLLVNAGASALAAAQFSAAQIVDVLAVVSGRRG